MTRSRTIASGRRSAIRSRATRPFSASLIVHPALARGLTHQTADVAVVLDEQDMPGRAAPLPQDRGQTFAVDGLHQVLDDPERVPPVAFRLRW
jgi:hypothetical protein